VPADHGRPTASLVALDPFSRPWGLAVLAECFLGIRRFDQFQRRLGISRKTLSQRLSSLVDDGLLAREKYQSRPDRFEYLLTAKGRDLFPIVLAIKNWGERWAGVPDGNRWHVEHIPCQQPCGTSVVCTHCAEQVHHQDVRMDMSPDDLVGSPAARL
jgi:DNA-binding HxlR family transcriptional regulator